jgi:hypothetical protein
MNPAMRKSLTVGEVRSWLSRLLACGLLVVSLAGWTADEHTLPDLTVHEWGTFTAIAGKDGQAAEWLPLDLPRYPPSTDLPQFVEHINGVNFKLGLRGTIRMETPVLYFYSPRDVTVSARVSFSKGLITEWYPHADRVEPAGVLTGTVGWKHRVEPRRGFSESGWRVPQRRADESLLRRSRDRFFAAARPEQCGGAAGEVPFLSRSFR